MPENPDVSDLQLSDLFDIDELQKIQDTFALATGVASIITDTQGRPITKPSNFCRLCEHVIRKTQKGLHNCYCSDAMLGRMHPEGPLLQRCLSGGLWDAGTSICVGDRHIANWLIGQVLEEPVDEQAMLAYAEEIGADAGEFCDALGQVTRMPLQQFQRVTDALHVIASQLSRLAIQNVQQAHFINARKQAEEALRDSEERYRLITENTADTISILDLNLRPVYVSASITKLRGYTAQEAVAQSLPEILTPESFQKAFQVFAEHMELEKTAPPDPSRSVYLELEEFHHLGRLVSLLPERQPG